MPKDSHLISAAKPEILHDPDVCGLELSTSCPACRPDMLLAVERQARLYRLSLLEERLKKADIDPADFAGPACTLGNLDKPGRLAPAHSTSYTFLRAIVIFPRTEMLPWPTSTLNLRPPTSNSLAPMISHATLMFSPILALMSTDSIRSPAFSSSPSWRFSPVPRGLPPSRVGPKPKPLFSPPVCPCRMACQAKMFFASSFRD